MYSTTISSGQRTLFLVQSLFLYGKSYNGELVHLKSMLSDKLRKLRSVLVQTWDADHFEEDVATIKSRPDKFDLGRCVPFIFLHAGCLGVFFVGWSPIAVTVAILLYLVRMFAITGFYHRYFSHRTFHTSRAGQFLFAIAGNLAVQRGALWWAATHRHHHQHADHDEDVHSPGLRGFWWAHIGWMTSHRNFPTDYQRIKDLARFPELVFLNRFDLIVPAVFGVALLGFGSLLNYFWPQLGTSGWQMVVWGFFVSTIFLLHATLCINSLAHTVGSRRFDTDDDSRNSLFLALITLGEGWHNNHHRYMSSARQGFFWWEIDITYYVLKMLSWTGLIWDLRPVPASALGAERAATPNQVVAVPPSTSNTPSVTSNTFSKRETAGTNP
jgi:stearoyl-CoA desaturase (delta-9 desaturase)